MSNTFQSVIAQATGILMNYYQKPLIDNLNETLPVWRAAEKEGKESYTGTQVIRSLRLRRNQGIGATSENGILPSIGAQTYAQAQIAAKYNYLRFGVTAPFVKAAKGDRGTFMNGLSAELEFGFKDLKKMLNRQVSWNGNGTIASMSSAAVAATSITIAGRESTEPALKFVDVGTTFSIYTTAGALVQAGITVNSITTGTGLSATAVLVVNTPVTASAGDVLTLQTSGTSNEIQGLLTALDGGTSTIYNIDRSTYISYQGNVTAAGGAQLTLDMMQSAYNNALYRGNVGKLNAVWCDFNSLRYYQKLLTPDKRYVNTQKGDGTFGNKGEFYLDFMGIPVVPDPDCPTRFFFLPAEVLKIYTLAELEAADETGSMLISQDEVDSWEVRIRQFCNFFNEQPAACAALSGYISP